MVQPPSHRNHDNEVPHAPFIDLVMSELFARDHGQTALIGFLGAALKPIAPIVTATVSIPKIPRHLFNERGHELDICLTLADGAAVDVKLQVVPTSDSPKHALYLASSWLTAAHKLRGASAQRRRPAIAIFLVSNDLFPERPHEFEVSFSLHQDDAGPAVLEELAGQVQIKFLEITKASRLWLAKALPLDDMILGAWLGYFADPTSAAVAAACAYLPELQDAREIMEEISRSQSAQEAPP
ncbi:MAG: hypothetical protein FJ146_18745 [Deltaproteobacteria bacterium]|nr:hypothetical protein [Deltaproteobacteria bacterium]